MQIPVKKPNLPDVTRNLYSEKDVDTVGFDIKAFHKKKERETKTDHWGKKINDKKISK